MKDRRPQQAGGRPVIPVVGVVTRDDALRQEVLAALSPECAVVSLDLPLANAPGQGAPTVMVVDADDLTAGVLEGRGRLDGSLVLLVAQENHLHRVRGSRVLWHDFVLRPCRAVELQVRVRRLLEEALRDTPRQIACGPISIDLAYREVSVHGRTVHLTNREFSLLQELAVRLGQPVSRQDLLDAVWGTEYEGGSNVVDVFIRSLRQKLEPCPARPRYILTVRGVGYRLVPGPSGDEAEAAGAGARVPEGVRGATGTSLAPALSTVT